MHGPMGSKGLLLYDLYIRFNIILRVNINDNDLAHVSSILDRFKDANRWPTTISYSLYENDNEVSWHF